MIGSAKADSSAIRKSCAAVEPAREVVATRHLIGCKRLDNDAIPGDRGAVGADRCVGDCLLRWLLAQWKPALVSDAAAVCGAAEVTATTSVVGAFVDAGSAVGTAARRGEKSDHRPHRRHPPRPGTKHLGASGYCVGLARQLSEACRSDQAGA